MKVLRFVASATVGLLVSAGISVAPAHAATSTAVTVVACINKSRIAAGLRPLAINTGLASTAQGWSSSMASRGSTSHNPSLEDQVPGGWTELGENVGRLVTARSSVQIHDGFMDSSAHKSNIMYPSFNSVGVGVTTSAGYYWVTEVFATYGSTGGYVPPASLCAAAPTPTPTKTTTAPKPSTPKATTAPKPSTPKATTAPKPSTPKATTGSSSNKSSGTSGKSSGAVPKSSSSLSGKASGATPKRSTLTDGLVTGKVAPVAPTPKVSEPSKPQPVPSVTPPAPSAGGVVAQPEPFDTTPGEAPITAQAAQTSDDSVLAGLGWLALAMMVLAGCVFFAARRSREDDEN